MDHSNSVGKHDSWEFFLHDLKSEMQIKNFTEQTLDGHYQISCIVTVYVMRDLYFNQIGTNVRQ